MSDDKFARIFDDKRLFNHPRFKALNEKAKEVEKLERLQKEQEEKTLAEQNKFQELAEKKAKEAEQWQSRFSQSVINNSIILEAQKLGVIDMDATLKLINRDGLEIGENDSVSGVKEALDKLLESKPYLKNGNTTRLGTGSNPSDVDQPPMRFTKAQLKDPKFFKEHEAEIDKALAAGIPIAD